MKVIIRTSKNHYGGKLIEVKNLHISSDTPGVTVEADNYMELFNELDNEGFNPSIVGKLINFEASSVSCFD